MVGKPLIFVVNPGSASRKYALYSGERLVANVHFELIENKVVGNLEFDGKKIENKYDDGNLGNASHRLMPLLKKHGVIESESGISAIGIRIVAPSRRFLQDEIIDDGLIAALDDLRQETPLHIKVALLEIKQLRKRFPNVPIIGVSDSRFHSGKPDYANYYPIDINLSKKFGIERYGFHGISVESVVNYLKSHNILLSKVIICHLGSGCSLTAILDGKSMDNTMGFSPLEGLMMSTRSGSIDVTAAIALKEKSGLTDIGIEQYLDKKAGLLGVSGSSDDIRQLLASESKGDKMAKLALDMYVYNIQKAIGQMAAVLDGVGCLVFTGTVGERSMPIRSRVIEKLNYLGFEINKKTNDETYEPIDVANLATISSKPILVVSTDEASEIARRTAEFIEK